MGEVFNAHLGLADCGRFPDLLGGMNPREVVALARGEMIYRFASSASKPALARAAAPWWWRERDFTKMVPYLKMDPSSVGSIARMQGAVPYSWSRVDVLLRAKLQAPIRVFVGPGRDQFEKVGRAWIRWESPPDLDQTYIPNLGRARHDPRWSENPLTEIGQSVLCEIRQIQITSQSFEQEWGIRPDQLHGLNLVMPGNPRWH